MAEIIYHPQYGCVQSNGRLRVPVSGRSEDGGVWRGETEIGPEHPSYAEWRHAISKKEQHLTALREERRQAREALRQTAELKRRLKQGDYSRFP